jgi:hypothetical protein
MCRSSQRAMYTGVVGRTRAIGQRLAEGNHTMRRLLETEMDPTPVDETGEPDEATIIEINSDSDD